MLRSSMIRAARPLAQPVARRGLASDALTTTAEAGRVGSALAEKGQGHASTMTFSNRPAWITPSKSHWLIDAIGGIGGAGGASMTGLGMGTGVVLGAVACCAYAIVEVNNSMFSDNDPVTCNTKWAKATHEKKMGKRPIYWETKAKPEEEEEDDEDDDE